MHYGFTIKTQSLAHIFKIGIPPIPLSIKNQSVSYYTIEYLNLNYLPIKEQPT